MVKVHPNNKYDCLQRLPTDRNVNFGGIIPEITAFNVQAGSHTSLFRAKICKYYWLRWVILIRAGFITFTTDEE